MKKRKLRKLKRAQPRAKTPPISFRDELSGDRTILTIDESFSTNSSTWKTSTRQPIFVRLGSGLLVTMQSRRIAKRRYAQLRIAVA